MSKKAAEHHRMASEHHTHAARHHGEAAKHHDNGQHEKDLDKHLDRYAATNTQQLSEPVACCVCAMEARRKLKKEAAKLAGFRERRNSLSKCVYV